MLKIIKHAGIISCVFLLTSKADAQYDVYVSPPIDYSVPPILLDMGVNNRTVIEETLQKEARSERSAGNKNINSQSYQAAQASLTFTPNMQRRKQTFNNLLAEFDKLQPGIGSQFRPVLFGTGSGDIIQQVQAFISTKYGLKTNNLADAYTIYWISAWEATNGTLGKEPSISKIKAVKEQISRAFLSIPSIASSSDANKQSYSEVLLVQAALIGSFEEQVKAGTMKLSDMKEGVRRGSKALGVDLDSFILTETGFEPKNLRKHSDASEAAPGAEATAVASASSAKTDTNEGSSLLSGAFPGIVIAGLAGSGIAAAFLYGKNKGANKRNG
jgi:hypothetical protein